MKAIKRIGPFSGDQKPVRKGWYIREDVNGDLYMSYFGCGVWSVPFDEALDIERAHISLRQNVPWYGAAK